MRANPLELALSEADFQGWLIDAAHVHGWTVAHFRPAPSAKGWRTPMSGDPGFPDTVLVRAPRLIFAELKAQRAPKPRPDQMAWLVQLGNSGTETYVWRPSDRPEILRILAPGLRTNVMTAAYAVHSLEGESE